MHLVSNTESKYNVSNPSLTEERRSFSGQTFPAFDYFLYPDLEEKETTSIFSQPITANILYLMQLQLIKSAVKLSWQFSGESCSSEGFCWYWFHLIASPQW